MHHEFIEVIQCNNLFLQLSMAFISHNQSSNAFYLTSCVCGSTSPQGNNLTNQSNFPKVDPNIMYLRQVSERHIIQEMFPVCSFVSFHIAYFNFGFNTTNRNTFWSCEALLILVVFTKSSYVSQSGLHYSAQSTRGLIRKIVSLCRLIPEITHDTYQGQWQQ